MTIIQVLADDGVSVDVLVMTQKLERLQANLNLGSQFVRLRIGGKTVTVSTKPETDAFNSEDENGTDEDFTTETSETDKENATEDLQDEIMLMVTLNHTFRYF